MVVKLTVILVKDVRIAVVAGNRHLEGTKSSKSLHCRRQQNVIVDDGMTIVAVITTVRNRL